MKNSKELSKPFRATIGSVKENARVVAVRYFLDRPGMDLSQSSARLWENPPCICTTLAVKYFLETQGIALEDMLVEIYIDKFQSYLLLEACIASCVEWDFSDVSHAEPGILNVRLTDLTHAHMLDMQDASKAGPGREAHPPQHEHQHANTTPIGLFAFSMMAGLETTELLGTLVPDSVNSTFVLTWGPYMLMCGGFLEVLTGIFQIFRNNIYGTTAFLGYGSFWLSTGFKVVLETYFSGDVPRHVLESEDPWGNFFRNFYQLAFSAVILKQTFVMNKLSSILIFLACVKMLFAAFSGWNRELKWVQLCLGSLLTVIAFYMFATELTNQIYHREVLPAFRWSEEHSPEEVFGAAGRPSTLYSKAARLRQANYPTQRAVRSVLPHEDSSAKQD